MSGKKKEITLRSQEQKRKTVFKAVLNSPYTVKWSVNNILCFLLDQNSFICQLFRPEVSLEDQQLILEELCELNRRKGVTIDDETATSSKSISLPPPPPILSRIVIGINDVTRHLEQSINPNIKRKYVQGFSDPLISTNPNNQLTNPSPIVIQNEHLTSLRMIFVCKADILPPHLCAHLPIMSSIARDVLLVPLPSGAEELISNKLGIKRTSCIGVKIKTPEFDVIYKLAKDKVGPVNAPWLIPFKSEFSKKRKGIEEDEIIPSASVVDDFMKTACNEYAPTQIKQLITSAPVKSKMKQKKIKGQTKATEIKKT
ncbi:8694_t:CDS:2 [Racocetra fulgida]|uniref:8694_t:CDS:1 n=1 Tax=Racocetra fulgida TaxID=60492 RepID=A0A9N9BVD6_9GLOM|nr:8694_t:CDS:2 [Racocetra fulgida]